MIDPMELVARLGELRARPPLSGDDRSVETVNLAIRYVMDSDAELQTLERRRARDRLRPRRVPPNPPRSTESAENGGSPSFSPTPPFPTPDNDNNTAREAMEEQFATLALARLGPLFGEVEAFVRTHQVPTWPQWWKQVLTAMTSGGATPDDVAAACRDALALDSPLRSPKGFRAFVASSTRERHQSRSPVAGKPGVEHWTDRKEREERESAEKRRIELLVQTRRAKPDGDLWWARMQQAAGNVKAGELYRFAFQHLEESAA